MRIYVSGPLAFLLLSACLSAAQVQGKVTDPSGAPVAGAQIAIVSRLGVEVQTVSALNGAFELNAPDRPDAQLVVTAPGFTTLTVPIGARVSVQLEIAPQVDSVRVVGSAIDVSASQQGGSVSIVPSEDVRRRNEPFAFDLLRYLPGMAFNQTGSAGGVSSLFLRGGYSNFSLVQIDGVPVNAFGGGFDFAHMPSEAIDHIEVIRGPQSAVYGPYANSGVIDFVTRQPAPGLHLDLLAEGGSYNERRFGITGSGMLAGFGIVASASRVDTNGMVVNNDYRNEDVMLNVSRHFGRQSLSLHGDFNSDDVGEPGAWGSDPKHTFGGIDTISREKINFSDYSVHYEADLSGRVRQDLFGSFFLDNSGFRSKFGASFNQDLRGQGEARTIVSVSPHYTAAFGVSAGREEVKNSFISDAAFESFPLRRNDIAVYLENRFTIGGRLFLNAGVRGEFLETPAIPPDGFSRPLFPKSTISRANPKFAVAWLLAPGTRLHSSFGTGMRPPSGFELAFTNNPSLQPERTRSVDAGVEQKLFHNLLLLDGTYFYNRYYDLIVTLGGSLASLGHYQSANLANSQAQGAEFSASLRPARWVFVTGSYTLLETRILSLDGSLNQAPLPFSVGQPLTRRPENSGNVVATFTHDRITADLTGYFRGRALFEEPGLGAGNGLFWNSGYSNLGVNLNYALRHGVTVYGSLRNALNQHYEEVFGFPSPRLNFVAGLKWKLSGRQ
ncbi:MAG TPA: TonB-dependent receptor [Bryobacteraceae bacterium]|jgi:outer membrane receptor protein involved in Fe transport